MLLIITSTGGMLVKHMGSRHGLLKFTFNAEHFMYRVSPAIWAQFTFQMCVAAWNHEKSL